MGPVVISVVVVGACIVMGSWLAVGSSRRSAEPATASTSPARAVRPARPSAGPKQARKQPRGELAPPTRWWVRLRSAVVLGVLSTALGVAAAVGIGLALLLVLALLRASVG